MHRKSRGRACGRVGIAPIGPILGEANVDMFGKYINEAKKDAQFVLITHKKRMMEYADCLYGITMQESGVSKIVSTKLED